MARPYSGSTWCRYFPCPVRRCLTLTTVQERTLIKLPVSGFVGIFLNAYLGPCFSVHTPTAPARDIRRPDNFPTGNRYSPDAGIRGGQDAVFAIEADKTSQWSIAITSRSELYAVLLLDQDSISWTAPNGTARNTTGSTHTRTGFDVAESTMPGVRWLPAGPEDRLNSVSATCSAMPSRTQHDLHCLSCSSHPLSIGWTRHSPGQRARQIDAQDTRSTCAEHSTQHHTVRRLSGLWY